MAQNFPELTELQAAYLLEFESRINQDSPLNNKAFLRILSYVLAMIAVLLRVEVITASKENLAITASRDGLILIGQEYDVLIKEEISTVLTVNLPTTSDPTVIPAGTNFTGDPNGVLYYNSESVTSAAGSAVLTITSRTPGVIGNLLVGEKLTISRQIPGATLIATITAIDTTGADAEATEVYRQRVLDVIRAPGGGANSADYRNWAQEQEGVKRAYPYSGLPLTDPGYPGSPPDRTVYIEAQASIDPDGIAPTSLLDDTKDTIITDPVTGLHREPLGLTSATLYVESITRTSFFTQISNAAFVTGTEAQVKADISTAVDAYFLSLEPFVDGLDIEADRNDKITDLSLSKVIQAVLEANGASAEEVAFGDAPGAFFPSYQLGQGEKAKNGGITYV